MSKLPGGYYVFPAPMRFMLPCDVHACSLDVLRGYECNLQNALSWLHGCMEILSMIEIRIQLVNAVCQNHAGDGLENSFVECWQDEYVLGLADGVEVAEQIAFRDILRGVGRVTAFSVVGDGAGDLERVTFREGKEIVRQAEEMLHGEIERVVHVIRLKRLDVEQACHTIRTTLDAGGSLYGELWDGAGGVVERYGGFGLE